MAQTKITLFDMVEAIGDIARSARIHVEIWDRDHPHAPLADDNQWVVRAETLEAAHRGFALLALNPKETFALVNTIKETDDGKQLSAMLAPQPRRVFNRLRKPHDPKL